MIRNKLPNYSLSNVHLNRCKSYFKFNLMLAGDRNLNPGPIKTVHNINMCDDPPFCNCKLSIDWTEPQFNIDNKSSNSGDKWSMLKNRGVFI